MTVAAKPRLFGRSDVPSCIAAGRHGDADEAETVRATLESDSNRRRGRDREREGQANAGREGV